MNGKWQIFEGSDDPTDPDMKLYSHLILGAKKGEMVLYGTHGMDFIHSWDEKGIPKDVYFSTSKLVAMRHWHTSGDDMTVKIKMPENAVIKTADREYKTIRVVKPKEFKIIGFY